MSANARGALLMTGSMFGFAINDGLMKLSFETLPIGEGIFFRGVFATLVLLALSAARGHLRFRPDRREARLLALRSGADVVGSCCYLSGLAFLSLATASAVLQAAPLAVTFAAALILREPVGAHRWAAILVGFCGMLVMLRPGTAAFQPTVVLPLFAVAAIVTRDIATRRLPQRVPALYAATLNAGIIASAGGGLMLIEGFVPPTAAQLALYGGATFFVVFGYVLGVASMRAGDISAVSPFRYTVLVFSVLLGMAVFGDMPDAATLGGAAIVIAAGLYTLWREARAGRARVAAEAAVRDFAPE